RRPRDGAHRSQLRPHPFGRAAAAGGVRQQGRSDRRPALRTALLAPVRGREPLDRLAPAGEARHPAARRRIHPHEHAHPDRGDRSQKMTSRRELALILLVLIALVAARAEARHAVVVLPPGAGDAEGEALGLVMQARASEILVATGGYQDLHAKQILRVAERERLASPEVIARRLGAERAVAAKLARAGGGWTLDGTPLPSALPQMIDAGALALARRIAPKAAVPGRPLTSSAPALAAYASCYAILVRQPIGVETPVVIAPAELDRAIASCRAAVAADGSFQDARAAL